MKFDRFQMIIEYNCRHRDRITCMVQDFYRRLDVNYETSCINLKMTMKSLFNNLNYFVLEIPFKDGEIGAFSYKKDYYGYTILNSSLPQVNLNFALAHEIYHIVYQDMFSNKRAILYIDEHYNDQEEEKEANLFAGILLMPSPLFVDMFRRYEKEQKDGSSYLDIIIKLMNYFSVPYMAVVTRLYELTLLPDGEVLQKLLSVTKDEVVRRFEKLWLDDSILLASKRDDYSRLEEVVKNAADFCEKRDLVSRESINSILDNMRKIYEEIRG